MSTPNEIISKFLDDFEAEQLHILQLDPRERGMQAHYSTVMGVMHGVRQFLRGRTADQPANAAEAKLVPEDKICEMWGAWYDGSRGGISGWVGGNGIPDLFQSKEKAQMICPTEAYQPRLIFMYAALPVPVDAQPTKTDCND